jgi:ribulose-phosphate 3-epimerase
MPRRNFLPQPLPAVSGCFFRTGGRIEVILMIKIAPSILSADFSNLERDIRRVETADYLHVDVMDGMFVPNISIGLPVVRSVRAVTSLPLDVHLMIVQPLRYAAQFCDAGADLVSLHVESDTQENLLAAIRDIHAKGKRAGVVVKPKTPAEAVLPFLTQVELILVMTVEPGFGGQKFMADQMPKVRAIRQLIDRQNPACELEVDGGVAPDTCRQCIEAGANVLVAGSSVYHAPDIPARIRELRCESD